MGSRKGKYVKASSIGTATFCKRSLSMQHYRQEMSSKGYENIVRGNMSHNELNDQLQSETANIGLLQRLINFILKVLGIR